MSKYHQYTECGLDDVYLVNGFTVVESPRGSAIQIENVEGLHRIIGLILVNEKKALSGKEVRFLRHELSLTQQSLGAILGVDAQTIARWEKGETDRVTPAADRLLRLIYLEKVEGNPAICEPLQRISELDESLGEQGDLLFVDDPDAGWRLQEPMDLLVA
jgi:putative transcriptional regulator